ncbi:MAG: carboxypeptidase-like regulatory domain-containing protein, partial [Ignavibacteriaceae bacterium]
MKIFFLFFLFSISVSFSQNLKITGTIRDASSGEPLPLANISLTDNSRGASTDMNGRYELTLPPGNYMLI